MRVSSEDPDEIPIVFLREAEDTLGALEGGLGRLRDAAGVTPTALIPLALLAHRLAGAAALLGFGRLSRLAGSTEKSLERARHAPEIDGAGTADLLADQVVALRKLVDAIRTTGQEDVAEDEANADRHSVGIMPTTVGVAGPPEVATSVAAAVSPQAAPHSDALSYFVPEAVEHLEIMTGCLQALEQGRGTGEELATLFRAAHTLKGAAYVVGCTAIGDLAHRLEDVLAAVRLGRLVLSPSVIEGFHTAIDAVRRWLGVADGPSAEVARVMDEALAGLSVLVTTPEASADGSAGPAGLPGSGATHPAGPVAADAPRPSAEPSSARRRGGERLESLLSLVGELVIARTRLDHDLRRLEGLEEQLSASRTRMTKALGDFESRPRALPGPMPRNPASASNLRSPAAAPSRRPPREDSEEWTGPGPGAALFGELELDRSDESDLLTRRIGEITADLAVGQTQLAGIRRLLAQDAVQIQRLTASLGAELMRARLVPVRRLFSRVGRQIRAFATAAGKTVAVELSGEAVDVDSTIVERMADPILHLVRNAVVHGIEDPDERRTRGKPPHGTVSLGAAHRGASVYVEVKDDGRGIDPERLKEQAVRQGLLPLEVARLLEGREALDLIFLPGLSTAPLVTPAAGRGVGMDIVRAGVAALGGEITVETEPGAGTRFTIKLPLTVAATDALFVRVGAETLAIPLNAIKRLLRVSPERIQLAGPGERIRVDDELTELVRLDRVLGLPPAEPTRPVPVVMLGGAAEPVAVAVAELLGKQEIVIKGLGAFLDGVGPFAGATVSAEGRVILVLDPARLRDTARAQGVTAIRLGAPLERAAPSPAPAPILLVDDSISVRKFVAQMLARAGFDVLTAGDGAEALAVLEETTVALMITDLEMPRVNGFELVRELRRRPGTRDLPIVVLTTRVGAKHLNLARWLGVTDYVSKPVDELAFVGLIGSLMRPAGPHHSASASTTAATVAAAASHN